MTKNDTTAGQHDDVAENANGDVIVLAEVRHTSVTDTATKASAGTLPEGVALEWVAPRDLLLDANVRTDVCLTAEFVASIRDLGVLTPVVAVRSADGLRVRQGQRRTLAAVEAGREGIPVYVVPAGDDAERIVGQLAENVDRAAMTATETAAAYEQLALLGLSAAQIAKRTRRPQAEITAGLTVAKSATATNAAESFTLDLVSASVFAEFEDDEDATTRLTQTAEHGGSLAHTAQRIRDDRARAAAIATCTVEMESAGVTVVRRPSYWEPKTMRTVETIRAKGSREPFTVEAHATCPGHAAWIDADTEPGQAAPVYVCADFKAHGHLRWTNPDEQTTRTPMSEDARAERKRLIENNKAWHSAETVRREWLTSAFAARKTTHRGGAEFVAKVVASHPGALASAAGSGLRVAARTLGFKGEFGAYGYVSDLLAKASTARAQVITLVIALAAIEESTSVQSWRYPGEIVAAYLTALESWGYVLSDVELIACGRTPATTQANEPAVA